MATSVEEWKKQKLAELPEVAPVTRNFLAERGAQWQGAFSRGDVAGGVGGLAATTLGALPVAAYDLSRQRNIQLSDVGSRFFGGVMGDSQAPTAAPTTTPTTPTANRPGVAPMPDLASFAGRVGGDVGYDKLSFPVNADYARAQMVNFAAPSGDARGVGTGRGVASRGAGLPRGTGEPSGASPFKGAEAPEYYDGLQSYINRVAENDPGLKELYRTNRDANEIALYLSALGKGYEGSPEQQKMLSLGDQAGARNNPYDERTWEPVQVLGKVNRDGTVNQLDVWYDPNHPERGWANQSAANTDDIRARALRKRVGDPSLTYDEAQFLDPNAVKLGETGMRNDVQRYGYDVQAAAHRYTADRSSQLSPTEQAQAAVLKNLQTSPEFARASQGQRAQLMLDALQGFQQRQQPASAQRMTPAQGLSQMRGALSDDTSITPQQSAAAMRAYLDLVNKGSDPAVAMSTVFGELYGAR